MSDLKERLRVLLRATSYERRAVTLASGRTSDFYIDGKQTTLHPVGAMLIGPVFLDLIEAAGLGIEAVGGPTLGADPIVAVIAAESARRERPIPAFIIRKAPKGHGTGQWIEGMKNLRPGMKVAIVEDTMTTGGSALTAAEKAREAGLDVVLVACLCDRLEGAREAVEAAGLTFAAVFTRPDMERP
jgi:orotate phosphoribosyltransferase